MECRGKKPATADVWQIFYSFASIAYGKNHLSEARRAEFMIFAIQKAAEQNWENQHIR